MPIRAKLNYRHARAWRWTSFALVSTGCLLVLALGPSWATCAPMMIGAGMDAGAARTEAAHWRRMLESQLATTVGIALLESNTAEVKRPRLSETISGMIDE